MLLELTVVLAVQAEAVVVLEMLVLLVVTAVF
jgi:hypothetical protein